MVLFLRKITWQFFLILLLLPAYAKTQPSLTLKLQNAYLPDAIRFIAKKLHLNVMISPAIKGEVNLQFDYANSLDAFNLLLASNGLTTWQVGSVWYIAPRDGLIKHKQEELKWQEAKEDAAKLITQVWQIKYAKAEDILPLFQGEHGSFLSKRGRIYIDKRTNSFCIQDVAEKITTVHHLIKRLDIPVQQIGILVRLAAIDNDFERELGLHFVVKPFVTEENTRLPMKQETGHYSLAIVKLADSSLLDVKLSALEKAGRAELISRPSLFTANQQLASIEAGEEVPYQEVSESGGTALVFKKAVLGLKVTPQVLPGNNVLLQLQINQDRPSNKLILGMPTISTRQIMTNVLVKSGQTIVLGGIYETNKENTEERMPFVSKIPIIGILFKQHSRRESKRELLIFVTPKIIA